MATRGVIRVEGISFAQVYKHWDCYPESGLLDWLEEFNKRFTEDRGDDPEYKFAQLLRASILDADKYGLDDSTTTGWGVYPYGSDHGEEYTYTLRRDGKVDCHDVFADWPYTRLKK